MALTGDRASDAQHVRAEFYVPGYGWIPVDPSDVRRVIALEGISDRDSKLAALRKVLFGVWEMNWIAYNVGSDVPRPGGRGHRPLPRPAPAGKHRRQPDRPATPCLRHFRQAYRLDRWRRPAWRNASTRRAVRNEAPLSAGSLYSAPPGIPEQQQGGRRPGRLLICPRGEVLETRVFAQEGQAYGAGGAVTLLADDDLGDALVGVSGL